MNSESTGSDGNGCAALLSAQAALPTPASGSGRPAHVLVLDPSHINDFGHHATTNRRLAVAAADIGARATFLCSDRAPAATRQGIGATGAFRVRFYDRKGYSEAEFHKWVKRTLEDLVAWQKPSRFQADIIAIPTLDQTLAMALGRYLSLVRTSSRPHVLAWFLMPPDFLASRAMPTPEVRKAAEHEVRQAIACLVAELGDASKLQLFCETKEMARRYGVLLGLPVGVAPCPNMLDVHARNRRPAKAGAPLRFVSLGYPTPEKGYRLLPLAIRRALDAGIEAEFIIHAAGSFREPSTSRVLHLLDEIGSRVTVHDHGLSDDEYYGLLTSSDVLMLPYDPSIYLARGSGIFNEAEAIGIPTIVTQGCGFASEAIADGRCIAAAGQSGEDLAQAIMTAATRLDEVRKAAQAHATREAHGPVLEELLQAPLEAYALDAKVTSPVERRSFLARSADAIREEGTHRKVRARRHLKAMKGRRKAWKRGLKKLRYPLGKRTSGSKAIFIPDLLGDRAWDADLADPPRRKYVIAAMPRSGSNLMVRQLYRSELGLPAEYFHPKITAPLLDRWGFAERNDIAYVEKLLRSRCSRGLVWGCKLHWEHLESLSEPVLDRIFDGARIIMTRRRDLASQALSLGQALRSGRWDPRALVGVTRDATIRADDVEVLLKLAEGLVGDEKFWCALLQGRGLPVHTVWYEDHLADQDETYRQIFDFLGVERSVPQRERPPSGKTGQSKLDRDILPRLRERIREAGLERMP